MRSRRPRLVFREIAHPRPFGTADISFDGRDDAAFQTIVASAASCGHARAWRAGRCWACWRPACRWYVKYLGAVRGPVWRRSGIYAYLYKCQKWAIHPPTMLLQPNRVADREESCARSLRPRLWLFALCCSAVSLLHHYRRSMASFACFWFGPRRRWYDQLHSCRCAGAGCPCGRRAGLVAGCHGAPWSRLCSPLCCRDFIVVDCMPRLELAAIL